MYYVKRGETGLIGFCFSGSNIDRPKKNFLSF